MKIEKLENGALSITGTMDAEEDYLEFRKTIRELNLEENDTLHVIILEAPELHLSIYGLLMKLHNKQNIHIILDVMEIKLAYFLRDVYLLNTFSVTLLNPPAPKE